jgi:hypothetical protein
MKNTGEFWISGFQIKDTQPVQSMQIFQSKKNPLKSEQKKSKLRRKKS